MTTPETPSLATFPATDGCESTLTDSQFQQQFTWNNRDRHYANCLAWALDMSRQLMHSELIRESSLELSNGGYPSLLHAWRFFHAARLLAAHDDSALLAQARTLGARIATAVLGAGSIVVDVSFMEVGSSSSYVAKTDDGAVEERAGVLRGFVQLTEEGRAVLQYYTLAAGYGLPQDGVRMTTRARFHIAIDCENVLVIADDFSQLDTDDYDYSRTVTNDAENVVASLASILHGRRLFYVDSCGRMDELVYSNAGVFLSFAAVIERGAFRPLGATP